ncbi:hypothetical protein BDP27DRAFT_292956 [Rhodocollybia butyracea]|uniref:NAD(P)-binding protein n=1 Tax=Rhodocollybia butyracea TaxID=206335 RepID=A0A9P5PB71_9AGAR|nr:hypothetical protein BDP27DRAFT_292956 [Rhodocollybia butyracea]
MSTLLASARSSACVGACIEHSVQKPMQSFSRFSRFPSRKMSTQIHRLETLHRLQLDMRRNRWTGIRLTIAQAFANNGARVYITSRRKSVLNNVDTWRNSLAHPKGQLIAVECDSTSKESIQSLVKELKENRGEKIIDVFVNNAGVSLKSSENFENWEEVYRTNVIGHFSTTAAFIPLLTATSSVHPGRTAAVRTSQYHFKYNVSKSAASHLTTLLSQELQRKKTNIRSNSVMPEISPSEMTTKKDSDEMDKSTIVKMTAIVRIRSKR